MRKGDKYKLFSEINTIVAVIMVAIMVLGVSYGYWSDSLTVNAEIGTGKLMVEGIVDAYTVNHEYPSHDTSSCPEGEKCTFKNWWEEQASEGKVTLSNNMANKSPIIMEDIKLKVRYEDGKIVYDGTADVIFTIKNTGSIPAEVSLYGNEHIYKKAWVKLSAPHKDKPSVRATLAQGIIDVREQSFGLNKDGQITTITAGNSFGLNPGQEATITLDNCKLDIYRENGVPAYDTNQLNLDELRIEAQASVYFKDTTESWYNNTCNSLFTNKKLEGNYRPIGCALCDDDCKGKYVPINESGQCEDKCKESHCVGNCRCFKKNHSIEEIPDNNVPNIEGPADIPVTLPADDEDVIVGGNSADIPVTLPADDEDVIVGGNPADIPVTLPADDEDVIVGGNSADIPVTLPADDEDIIVGDTPSILPVEPEDESVADTPMLLPLD